MSILPRLPDRRYGAARDLDERGAPGSAQAAVTQWKSRPNKPSSAGSLVTWVSPKSSRLIT